MKSVAASIFGVQSQRNYQQDFENKNPMPYIVVGIVFVIALVLSLVFTVQLVLN
jgi:hypothetical protein